MCLKCLKAMEDPAKVMDPANQQLTNLMVRIMHEDCLSIFRSITVYTMAEAGIRVHPSAIAMAFGWFYYATLFTEMKDKIISMEQIETADEALRVAVMEGVENVGKFMPQLHTVNPEDLPEDVRKFVDELLKTITKGGQ